MKKHPIHFAALLCLLVLFQLLHIGPAQAAPGDVLSDWGRKPLFHDPYAMTSDKSGNIYVVDSEGLQVFNSSGTLIRKLSSAGAPNGVFGAGIGVDGNRNTYMTWSDGVIVYDKYGHFIRKWQTSDPNGMTGSPSNLAVTSTGNVYVSDFGGKVQLFDKNGGLLRRIGSYGTVGGNFSYPMGLALDAHEKLYVLDTRGRSVQIFDTAGKFLGIWQLGTGEEGIGYPTRIAIGGNGNVYINDETGYQVRIYSSEGAFLGKCRGTGEGNGTFSLSWALAVGSDGRVYVSDITGRVQIFDAAGNFLTKWGSSGSGNGEFDYPNDCAMDQQGNFYVADSNNHRIQVLSRTGAFLRKWGRFGMADGEFNIPHGVALDRNGNVYVVDSMNRRIQIFDNAGTFLRKWSTPPVTSIAIDDAGNVYAVGPETAFVYVYDNAGNLITQWGGEGDDHIGQPGRVAVGGGKVYLTDLTNSRINLYDKTGTFLGSLGEDLWFMDLSGLFVDSNGSVYVTDSGLREVTAFDGEGMLRGQWDEWSGSQSNADEYMYPVSVLADTLTNRILVIEGVNNRILVHEGFGDHLPPGWTGRDIEYLFLSGRSSYANGIFTLRGSGEYMAKDADFFRFTYRPFSGDGEIVARVTGVQKNSSYGRGGIMIRAGLSAFSPYAMVDITAGNGAEFSSRATDGVTADVTTVAGITAPYWVKLVRQGNTFSGYISPDGIRWRLVGTSNVAMTGPLYVGLIASSNSNFALSTVTMDRVSLSGQTNAPYVKITAPGDGAAYIAPATVAIRAEATGGTWAMVKDLEFFSGSTAIGTSSSAPFTANWSNVPPGTYSLTAKVTDSLGATATSNPVPILVHPAGWLPAPWSTGDVGAVAAAGSTSYLDGAFTLKGAGADIWSTADGFRYLYQSFTGDLQIVARVTSVQNTSPYAKGGVMIRQALTPSAPHAMMDVTPGNGAEFSRRLAAGGTTSATLTRGITAPYWVKLVRTGNTFTGSISSDGVNWLQVGRSPISMVGPVYVGVIANSHNPALCSVTVDSVSVTLPGDTSAPTVTEFAIPATSTSLTIPITALTATDNTAVTGYLITESAATPSGAAPGWSAGKPASYTFASTGSKTLYAWAKDAAGNISTSRSAKVTVSAGALPIPWLTQDIGSVGVIGSAAYANGVFTVKGSGADIWGSADAFRFVYKVMSGDGEIIAKIASLQNTNSYAKAGVMMRQSLNPDSMQVMMDLKPTGGAEFSRRTSTGGPTSATIKSGVAAPYWVRLVRAGNTFTGSVSSDGVTWSHVGSATISMNVAIYVGLIVNSHNNSVLSTATMSPL